LNQNGNNVARRNRANDATHRRPFANKPQTAPSVDSTKRNLRSFFIYF
jgi:hypothetical protein